MLSPISIAPCLWFDDQAEEAVAFYRAIFLNSTVHRISRYGEAGFEHHHKPAGSVLAIDFELDGHRVTALNGGPIFRFTEAISLQVICQTQDEIDHYWNRLSEGGDPRAQQCGWLKDRFGLSWQIVPAALPALMADPDPARAERVMTALLRMTKLDLAALLAARDGGHAVP